jgi:hypothetical protein
MNSGTDVISGWWKYECKYEEKRERRQSEIERQSNGMEGGREQVSDESRQTRGTVEGNWRGFSSLCGQFDEKRGSRASISHSGKSQRVEMDYVPVPSHFHLRYCRYCLQIVNMTFSP